jgi:hypothetical protein
MNAPKNNNTLKVLAAVSGSFTLLALGIIVLAVKQVVTFQMALLMLVAQVGLYFGFGVLIMVYRFTAKLK